MINHKLPHDHGKDIHKILEKLPYIKKFAAVSDIFSLLGDFSRMRIFWILCHCEECVINLSAITDMTSPAVSHHLKLLKAAGLIESRRDGKEVYYKAVDSDEVKLLHNMLEEMIKITCPVK